MSLRITFELGESDLKHFRTIMRDARTATKDLSADEIIESVNELLEEVRSINVPEFIGERLLKLDTMIRMAQDDDWKLPPTD